MYHHKLLLFTVLACWGCAAAILDVVLKVPPNMTNPSVLYHNHKLHVGMRRLHFTKKPYPVDPQPVIRWWVSTSHVCRLDMATWESHDCQSYDPWDGEYEECLKPVYKDMEEGIGIEDIKLFFWPGKGVYGVFGRKFERAESSPFCPTLAPHTYYVKAPLLVKLSLGGKLSNAKPQALTLDPLLNPLNVTLNPKVNTASEDKPVMITEKNWMPFIYNDELYFMHSFSPARILKYQPDGKCKLVYNTPTKLPEHLQNQTIHGSPPIVLIPAHMSRSKTSYYLGIVHHYTLIPIPNIKWKYYWKHYHHYAFKMAAEPPFNVLSMSSKIPMIMDRNVTGDRAYAPYVAFANGLQFVESQEQFTNKKIGTVLISYGSQDIASRMMIMKLDELEDMFDS